jgi:hypothetical protein
MSLQHFMSLITGAVFVTLPIMSPSSAAPQTPLRGGNQNLSIPSSLESEHQALHAGLASILKLGGRTASEAGQVEKLLQPHFQKEASFALPPLGVLAQVAAGKTPDNRDEVILMARHLKAELPDMLREHKNIVAALQRLREAAAAERQPDAIEFADQLVAHASQEEQILYPGAILVGEYLQLKK